MALSVNTNMSAAIALQNLNATTRELDLTQQRVNTGLEVSSAKDNAAIYAIAQNMRGDLGAYEAVDLSLSRGTSIVDVALAAGESVSDLLVEMKEKVVAASDVSLDTASREALNEDFQALMEQVTSIVENATFDGANILQSGASDIQVLADSDASSWLTIGSEDLSLSGTVVTLRTTSAIDTLTGASAALSLVSESLTNVNAALARIGTDGKKIEAHQVFVSKLVDTLTGGVGNLVDADLATESAKLTALQVKQQLGSQALAIANQRPQILLSLFG